MNFIEREIKRIDDLIKDGLFQNNNFRNTAHYREIYSAKHALLWAQDPYNYRNPNVFLAGPSLRDSVPQENSVTLSTSFAHMGEVGLVATETTSSCCMGQQTIRES